MSSKQVGIEDARKSLGFLVDEACSGTDIVLTRRGQPVARIVPIEEPTMPTITEFIDTFRAFATVPVVVDTLGIEDRSPGLMDLGRAQLAAEAVPFAKLVADIDAFFPDGDMVEALTGPEAAEAEAEVRRIIAENLATVTMRQALTAAALSRINLVSADTMTLQTVARVALQRAADQRFVEVASRAVARTAA